MVFSSVIFMFMFLPLFLLCYFMAKKIRTKNLVLLLFSLAFYAWGEPYYFFLMLFMIIINYFLTLKMAKNDSKFIFILLIVINLLSLFSFKYLNFFIDNINNIFNLSINNIHLSLPIGISFYTFQILSYVIDVKKGKCEPQRNFLNLACYISAFPQLIAGPIVRYVDIEKELVDRKTTFDGFTSGVRRFIIGLAKKLIIANNVAFICDAILTSGIKEAGFIGILIATIAYSLQIYFDFSGYSDMAIGLGKMCGFNYNENFNNPYMAYSVTDFWRRWHISLSSFFRDYVYIPLGGNRCSTAKIVRNILIVWTLTGLWHGDSWNFVIWGLYYGIILLLEKFVFKNSDKNTWYNHIKTLIIVALGWLIFRQTNFNDLITSVKALFGGYGFGSISHLYYLGIFSMRYIIAFVAGIIFSLNIKMKDGTLKDSLLLILFIISIIFIVVNSYNPFIYFRF
ncbi:MAG: MBOAT family protein [Bacilli bacterium]|nr:MBOAT family protein [Bacilli bacterium]